MTNDYDDDKFYVISYPLSVIVCFRYCITSPCDGATEESSES